MGIPRRSDTPRIQTRGQRLFGVALLSIATACGSRTNEVGSGAESTTQAGDVLVRVGDSNLAADLVRGVSVAQGIPVAAAASALVADTIAALGFQKREPAVASYLRRVLLARLLLDEYRAEASRQGPVTDSELALHTAQRWQDLDRPASARVTHVVVMFSPKCDHQAAHRASERVLSRLQARMTVDEFRAAAKAPENEPCEHKVEDLQPVTLDGRTLGSGGGSYVAAFAQGANQLTEVGQHSGLVETEFGFHVLLLTERVPELRVPADERRARLLEEVKTERAKALMDKALTRVRNEAPPKLESEALALMELLQGAP